MQIRLEVDFFFVIIMFAGKLSSNVKDLFEKLFSSAYGSNLPTTSTEY